MIEWRKLPPWVKLGLVIGATPFDTDISQLKTDISQLKTDIPQLPWTPLRYCLLTPESQWQTRGKQRISQGWGVARGRRRPAIGVADALHLQR